MRWLESRLEDAGYTQLTQLIRWSTYHFASEDTKIQDQQWAQRIVVMDIKAHWTIQREIYMQAEVQALSKSLVLSEGKQTSNGTESSKLDAYRKELEQLNRQYWEYFRFRGQLEANVPLEPLGGRLSNTGRTLTGTATNCCARTVSCVMVAVDAAVDAVQWSEETNCGYGDGALHQCLWLLHSHL